MSLEGSYTSEIVVPRTQLVTFQGNLKESPCGDILQKAMEKIIRDHGGKMDTSYTDNEGKVIPSLLAVRTRDFPRGVGAFIEGDGRVIFRYDAFGDSQKNGQAICDEINQNYNVIAVILAQKRFGFDIRVKEQPIANNRKVVTVTGIR